MCIYIYRERERCIEISSDSWQHRRSPASATPPHPSPSSR